MIFVKELGFYISTTEWDKMDIVHGHAQDSLCQRIYLEYDILKNDFSPKRRVFTSFHLDRNLRNSNRKIEKQTRNLITAWFRHGDEFFYDEKDKKATDPNTNEGRMMKMRMLANK